MKELKLTDFTTRPGPGLRIDGRHSGEEWCDKYLVPSFAEGDNLVINLDGVDGFSSSFLREAFYGFVSKVGITPTGFRSRVKIVCFDEPLVVERILGYVEGK